MQYLFRDAAHLTLLRTTREQIHRGVKVEEFSLKTGDLVFFQTGEHLRHVGVYIGDNQFIHASSSQGVTVSDLGNVYWQSHFITARRVTENVCSGMMSIFCGAPSGNNLPCLSTHTLRSIFLLRLQNQASGLTSWYKLQATWFTMSYARIHFNGGPGGGVARRAGFL